MANKPPKLIDRPQAWACLMTNLLVLPGVGSIAAGQRIGWLHVGIATAGMAVMTGWAGWFIYLWTQQQQMPAITGPHLYLPLAGIGLFMFSWLASLFSSIMLILKLPEKK